MSTLNLSKTERIDVRVSTPVKQLLQEPMDHLFPHALSSV